MPGSIPPTSQLDWLISTTAMIVLFWSRVTRDLLKSFGWGIAALHRLMQRRSCHPRRPPHSISPLEGSVFEPSVPHQEKWSMAKFQRSDPGRSNTDFGSRFCVAPSSTVVTGVAGAANRCATAIFDRVIDQIGDLPVQRERPGQYR